MASVREIKTASGPRYVVDWYDMDGSRRKKNFRDRKTAERIASEIELKKMRIQSGMEPLLKPDLPISQMVMEYLKYMANHKESETIRREKPIFKSLQAYLGDIKIRAIRPIHLSNYLEYRQTSGGIKPTTAATEHRTLKAFFNVLMEYSYLTSNPMKGVRGPKVEPKIITILTDDECQKLLNVIDSPDYLDLIRMYLHTGARRRELLPPTFNWKKVDFKNKQITLVGKRRKSRIVPLDQVSMEILMRRKEDGKNEYPFKFDYHYLYKKYKMYVQMAGIRDHDLHGLRRTYGSKLVQSGVSIFVVSQLMGHSSVKVTETHYIHLLNENLHDAARTLDRLWS